MSTFPAQGTAAATAEAPRVKAPPLLLSWRLAIIGLLIVLAAVAWAVTDLRMAGMDEGPGTDPGAFGFYVTTWVVMMAAMMFPSIAPMTLMYVRLQRARRDQGRAAPYGATACFVGGYLLVWTAAGLLAYGLLKAGRALDGGALSWDEAGRWVAVGVLLAAAAYELTPLKDVCLRHCRGPLTFVLKHWRDGRTGALRMGVIHGGWCVGCCWGLMAALFALGAMSVAWMAAVGVLIAVEKMLPWRRVAVGAVTGVLVALAIAVAAVPDDVPGLTLPSETSHMSGMDMHEDGMKKDSGGGGTGMHEQQMDRSGGGMGGRAMQP